MVVKGQWVVVKGQWVALEVRYFNYSLLRDTVGTKGQERRRCTRGALEVQERYTRGAR